jgi:hypothetical protein
MVTSIWNTLAEERALRLAAEAKVESARQLLARGRRLRSDSEGTPALRTQRHWWSLSTVERLVRAIERSAKRISRLWGSLFFNLFSLL